MKDLKKMEAEIIRLVEQLDEENVIKMANKAMHAGMGPLRLLELINQGMNRVGKLYENRDYYIADLIMAGLIFKQVLELDNISAHFIGGRGKKIGKVVVGTVKDDIHDIGKDIFRGMMEASGFEVIDIGVDIPKEIFIKKVEEHKPDIVGLSGVLTSTVDTMQETIEAFVGAGLRDKVKFIIGGNHLTEDTFRFIGADAFANDAFTGVKICRDWMKGNEQGVNENE